MTVIIPARPQSRILTSKTPVQPVFKGHATNPQGKPSIILTLNPKPEESLNPKP